MRSFIFSILLVLLIACNNNNQATPAATSKTAEENITFFRVTAYIKGQIFEIKEKGLTPLKYTTINERTDSVLIKFTELDTLVKEFLHPEIDSTNMLHFFTQSKFLDQSVNAFTFTYEPKGKLPDSVVLKHWDVYIDPENNKVKRVYLVKKVKKNTTLQLTWQSNEWCKITTIVSGADGVEKIEKEEKISWDY